MVAGGAGSRRRATAVPRFAGARARSLTSLLHPISARAQQPMKAEQTQAQATGAADAEASRQAMRFSAAARSCMTDAEPPAAAVDAAKASFSAVQGPSLTTLTQPKRASLSLLPTEPRPARALTLARASEYWASSGAPAPAPSALSSALSSALLLP